MKTRPASYQTAWPTLAMMPLPVKILFTAILLTLALAMTGALAQIVVHDIIPTFYAEGADATIDMPQMQHQMVPETGRGDLFSEAAEATSSSEKKSLLENEQFIWTLKWSHIHLFGMNMIFFFLGAVTIFLDTSIKTKSWLIALPFIGVIIDIGSMWLKAFISPVFFWLHIPGGGLFSGIFLYVFFSGIREMWWTADRQTP